jgi:hypothetical protein
MLRFLDQWRYDRILHAFSINPKCTGHVRLRGVLSMLSTRYRAVGEPTRRIDEILLSLMPWSLTVRYIPGPNSVLVP